MAVSVCLLLVVTQATSKAASASSTVPLGFLNLTIPAGDGISVATSCLSFPLQASASAQGQMTGVVTALTSNTLSNSSAGWMPGQLSQPSTPYLVQFTSGAALGRTLLISTAAGTSNTATTLSLDAEDAGTVDLTNLGIVPGTDTYQIIPADTLSSILGTPAKTGVLGGTNASQADQVQLYSSSSGWTSYYYNTNSGWTEVGPPLPAGNTVIRPDSAIIYLRRGTTPLVLTLTGRVPTVARQSSIFASGLSFISNFWPIDSTLGASGIATLPGWTAAASSSAADLVQIYSTTNGWSQYFYNGANWIEVGPPIPSNGVVLPAGAAVILQKRETASGQALLSQPLPYSL